MPQSPPCSVESCETPAKSRSWCNAHYKRYRATGSPTGTRRPSLEQRLAAGITAGAPDQCWPWTRATNDGGYGALNVDGVVIVVHRLVFERHHGPIPPGHVVRHSCDNPPCCNPAHLVAGTQADNVADMHERNRAVLPPRHQGQQHPQAKLTEDQVRQIRTLRAAGATSRALEHEFGMSKYAIWAVVNRRTWSHVA